MRFGHFLMVMYISTHGSRKERISEGKNLPKSSRILSKKSHIIRARSFESQVTDTHTRREREKNRGLFLHTHTYIYKSRNPRKKNVFNFPLCGVFARVVIFPLPCVVIVREDVHHAKRIEPEIKRHRRHQPRGKRLHGRSARRGDHLGRRFRCRD